MKEVMSIYKYVALVTQVGLMMAVPIVGCLLLGSYLDKRAGTQYIFLLIFTLVGLVLAFTNLYRLSTKNEDIMDKKKYK